MTLDNLKPVDGHNMTPNLRVFIRTVVFLAALILGASSGARSARPVTPLMQTLMSVFPEERGWFVDGPLGVADSIPEKALAIFTQPRVIVPDIDALQIAVGKLFAASGQFAIKKIDRYDEKPGIDGLPGFRGIWCEAEDNSLVGFSILTPNQDRFLIWARDNYFRALKVDSMEGKIRDWYARSVSEYLASIDFKVPDNPIPDAAERQLPAWMELYPAAPPTDASSGDKLSEFMAANAEIKIWGWGGLTAFIPAQSAIDRFISSATDTLYADQNAVLFQDEYRRFLEAGGTPDQVIALTRRTFDSLPSGLYGFAVDAYGRVRIARRATAQMRSASESAAPVAQAGHDMLFPGSGVLTAGIMEITRNNDQEAIKVITTRSESYFYSRISPSLREDVTRNSETYLLSLGHLFASLKSMQILLDGVLIRKF